MLWSAGYTPTACVYTHTHIATIFGAILSSCASPFSRQSESIFCSSTEAIRPLDSPSPPRFSPISLLPSNRRLFPLPPSLRHATNYPPFRDTNYNFGSKAQTEKRSVGSNEQEVPFLIAFTEPRRTALWSGRGSLLKKAVLLRIFVPRVGWETTVAFALPDRLYISPAESAFVRFVG